MTEKTKTETPSGRKKPTIDQYIESAAHAIKLRLSFDTACDQRKLNIAAANEMLGRGNTRRARAFQDYRDIFSQSATDTEKRLRRTLIANSHVLTPSDSERNRMTLPFREKTLIERLEII